MMPKASQAELEDLGHRFLPYAPTLSRQTTWLFSFRAVNWFFTPLCLCMGLPTIHKKNSPQSKLMTPKG